MDTSNKQINEALESFFDSCSGETVEHLEKLLYEWYQHYAQSHCDIQRINEMVGYVFRVNDLLLKLNDAMIAQKQAQGITTHHLPSDHYDYSYAS
jgi:hypothetical protein